MIRKAILIGAPGAIKSKNFLEGVEIDLNHFEEMGSKCKYKSPYLHKSR